MRQVIYDAVIPAAGSGSRFGADKLTAPLGTATVVERAVAPFLEDASCQRIFVMAGANFKKLVDLFKKHKKVVVANGGSDRFSTVWQGLQLVKSPYVLVHDGARPFLNARLLESVLEHLQAADAVLPVLKPVDSVLRVEGGEVSYADRSLLRLVQTPQGFATNALRTAFELAARAKDVRRDVPFGDEGSLYLSVFGPARLALVDGDRDNVKITYASDLSQTL